VSAYPGALHTLRHHAPFLQIEILFLRQPIKVALVLVKSRIAPFAQLAHLC
jgi:hypothetical protein